MILPTEGDNRKEKEQELKTLMKRLEAKYAALQVVPVISKLGSPQVGAYCKTITFGCVFYIAFWKKSSFCYINSITKCNADYFMKYPIR